MNNAHPENGLPIEMLAAYIDGELSIQDRARVDAWLTDHPELAAELAEQEFLAASNEAFWNQAAPPAPTEQQWREMSWRLHERLRPEKWAQRQRWGWRLAGVVAALAASLLVAIFLRGAQPVQPKHKLHEEAVGTSNPSDEEEELFRVARADEVEIYRIPGNAHSALVVGSHPLEDAPLILVKAGDLEVLSFDGMQPVFPPVELPEETMIWPPRGK